MKQLGQARVGSGRSTFDRRAGNPIIGMEFVVLWKREKTNSPFEKCFCRGVEAWTKQYKATFRREVSREMF